MVSDPETLVVCLGDFNARLACLEPNIRQSDTNGQMIEQWVQSKGMHHLNQHTNCTGIYTFGKTEKAKSAIDHILVNDNMIDKFKGMDIDENKEQFNISDHNLIRAWFSIGKERNEKWKKKEYEIRTYYKTDEESLKNMEENLMSGIRGKISFNSLMDKVEIAQNRNLKEQNRVKVGKKWKICEICSID